MSDRDQAHAAETPAGEGGIFRDGQYISVEVPAIQPVQRQLPAISGINPLGYVQAFTEGRRNRDA